MSTITEKLSKQPFSEVFPSKLNRGFEGFDHHVFENFNQAIRVPLPPQFMDILKMGARVITKEEIALFATKGDQEAACKRGEEWDWIYGLDALETEFKGKGPDELINQLLTVDTVMRYNGLFSRMENPTPGEFRKTNIQWHKRESNMNQMIAEAVIHGLLEQRTGMNVAVYFAQCKGPKNPEVLVKLSEVTQTVQRVLKEDYLFDERSDPETIRYWYEHQHELNIPEAFKKWAKEQGRTDKLDLFQWLKDRNHYFPLADTLPKELETSLASVRDAKDMHPIEKACKVWFDIVRIHVSHEANKRTGKAFAWTILSAHGYIPPIIGKNQEREFLDAFFKGLFGNDEHLHLTCFVARLLKEQNNKTEKSTASLGK